MKMHSPYASSSALTSSSSSTSISISRASRLICNSITTARTNSKNGAGGLYLSRFNRISTSTRTSRGLLCLLGDQRNWKFQSLKLKATFDKVEGRFGDVDQGANNGEIMRTLKLGLMFATWYLFNIYFNIFNKQVLKVYPFPMTITAVQFGIGSVLILLMWTADLHKRPKISSSQLMVIVALAILHTMGNLFTNMSLLKVAVSFTHTVKAMEPFFSVLLSAFFLGEQPSALVLSTLLPVVGGVALASFTEASFNWVGFWSAMASNLTNQSRNVISKVLMTKKEEEALDTINLFSIITLASFLLSAILMLFTEGITFTPAYLQAAGLNAREIYMRCLLAGLCFHAYQQAGYMLLSYVSPVSHSVGNCVKRVVVIVSSVLFFRTPISLINSLGTGIALAGVFLYSRVKKINPKSS